MKFTFSFAVLAALLLTATPGAVAALEKPPVIEKISVIGSARMTSQRALIDDLVSRNFGSGFNGNKTHDIALLQRTLDRNLVTSDQTPELQAMGVILGDLLAQELGMHWVTYQDQLGRSKALRYRDSQNLLFPITMISRRIEVGNRTPVAEIYQKAYDIIAARKRPLPYQ